MERYRNMLFSKKIINDIDGFTGKYKILSNDSNHEKISLILPYGEPNGKKYYANNIDTLFQAAKISIDEETQREDIIKSNDSKVARYLGNRYVMRKDWEDIRENVMKELLIQKFKVSNEFRNILLNIEKGKILVNFNDENDTYWGVSKNTLTGKNRLGILLMELKETKTKK